MRKASYKFIFTSIIVLILLIICYIFFNSKPIMTRKEVRDKSLQYFKNNFGLKIINTNKIFNYSPEPVDFSDPDVVSIVSVKRDENKDNVYNLPVFHMLHIKVNNSNSNIILFMSYLKSFCKADMSKLGIVSITNNNTLGLQGIEPYIPLFIKYGIVKQNIMIRTDVEYAHKTGEGDGYWRHPNNQSTQMETISIYYPLRYNSNIKNYTNKDEWLELGEAGLNYDDGDFGMERIEYAFFSIPYPKNNN